MIGGEHGHDRLGIAPPQRIALNAIAGAVPRPAGSIT
jgi:hypothetical protein